MEFQNQILEWLITVILPSLIFFLCAFLVLLWLKRKDTKDNKTETEDSQ